MTDLRKITTYGPGGFFAENENRLVLTGNGHRLAWDTTRYDSVREDLIAQVERARPFAVASTISRLDKSGSARLGPIEWRKDALLIQGFANRPVRPKSPLFHAVATLLTCGLWLLGLALAFGLRRAKKTVRVPLESISYASFEKGSLLIAADRKFYFPLRRVPNGIYFPALLDAIHPQAAAFEPSSRIHAQGA